MPVDVSSERLSLFQVKRGVALGTLQREYNQRAFALTECIDPQRSNLRKTALIIQVLMA